MFENPKRGRQASSFTKNVPKILDLKSSSEQIFSENWRWVPMIYHNSSCRVKIIDARKLLRNTLLPFKYSSEWKVLKRSNATFWSSPRLFTDSPELLQLFSFRDIELSEDVLRSDARFKKQSLVTMQHVDLAVTSLNDLGSVVPALKDLGARHSMYKVEEHHYGVWLIRVWL